MLELRNVIDTISYVNTTMYFFCQSIFKVPGSLPGNTVVKLRTKVSRQHMEQNENKLGR